MSQDGSKKKSDMEEAKRRADILERYVAIERPDRNDDAAAAAELGLSVDRTIRLAAAWTRHRSEALLVGPTAALNRGEEAPMHKVMAETITLEGVRPTWRDETLRRIRIVQRHIAADAEGGGDERAAAEEMGVSIIQFRLIAQAWRLHARAETLPGATRRGTPWRRQPERIRRMELLRSVIDGADPSRTLRAAYDVFVALCREEDLQPLSLPRFYGIANGMRKKTDRNTLTP